MSEVRHDLSMSCLAYLRNIVRRQAFHLQAAADPWLQWHVCLYEILVIRVFSLGGTRVFECISAGMPGAGRKQSRSYMYSELLS